MYYIDIDNIDLYIQINKGKEETIYFIKTTNTTRQKKTNKRKQKQNKK